MLHVKDYNGGNNDSLNHNPFKSAPPVLGLAVWLPLGTATPDGGCQVRFLIILSVSVEPLNMYALVFYRMLTDTYLTFC